MFEVALGHIKQFKFYFLSNFYDDNDIKYPKYLVVWEDWWTKLSQWGLCDGLFKKATKKYLLLVFCIVFLLSYIHFCFSSASLFHIIPIFTWSYFVLDNHSSLNFLLLIIHYRFPSVLQCLPNNFRSYADISIHEEMLSDAVRTNAYRFVEITQEVLLIIHWRLRFITTINPVMSALCLICCIIMILSHFNCFCKST